jgi:hypothetical protein
MKNQLLAIICFLGCLFTAFQTNVFAQSPEAIRSRVNQVFQFSYSETRSDWKDGRQTTARAYLWIPEECERLRGLLILCSNAPEHMLVGHQDIRKACAANDLGIFWGVRSFYNFVTKEDGKIVDYLQQLLNGLAETSGHEEVATIPWFPIGESGHLLMVGALLEHRPERCIAGVALKDPILPSTNWQTPLLAIKGTAYEWSQNKYDIRTQWNGEHRGFIEALEARKKHSGWPSPIYIAVRHKGTDTIRGSVQPAQISRDGWPRNGKHQKITFEPIADVPAGIDSIRLHASSDQGLPVRYFVDTGPAIIEDGKLLFTRMPP